MSINIAKMILVVVPSLITFVSGLLMLLVRQEERPEGSGRGGERIGRTLPFNAETPMSVDIRPTNLRPRTPPTPEVEQTVDQDSRYGQMEAENSQLKEELERLQLESEQERQRLLEALEFEKRKRRLDRRYVKEFIQAGMKLFFHLWRLNREFSSVCTRPNCRFCTPTFQSAGHHRQTFEYHVQNDQVYNQFLSNFELIDQVGEITNPIVQLFDRCLPMIQDNLEHQIGAIDPSQRPAGRLESMLLQLPEQMPGGYNVLYDWMEKTVKDNPKQYPDAVEPFGEFTSLLLQN